MLTADGRRPGRRAQRPAGQVPRGRRSRTSPIATPVSGLLVTDLDQDGRADLVAPSLDGRVMAWRNTTERTAADQTKITFEPWPINASSTGGRRIAADLDLDGLPDLLGLPAVAS